MIVCNMKDILDGSEHCAYNSRIYMISSILEIIVITHINGKPNVTFRNTAKAVFQLIPTKERSDLCKLLLSLS